MTGYLIIGGGLAAASAARAIAETDPAGAITLLSDEPVPPYDRPPLSKGLWAGKERESVFRDLPAGVRMLTGLRAARLEVTARAVEDNQGGLHGYDRLLLATGGRPRRLGPDDEGVIYYRTLADYDDLRGLTARGRQFLVLGGGFIGTEIAAALALKGCDVTMVFPESDPGLRLFPPALAGFVGRYYADKGVTLRPGTGVASVRREGGRFRARTTAGDEIVADGVIAGLGLIPNTELAEVAGLAVEDGIVVDSRLRTSRPEIFAAGDVARFPSPALGRAVRVEHEDNAQAMGALAGRNMAGRAEDYTHLPFFYSDLFDLGYEAVGRVDSRLEMVEDWIEPYAKGVVYYRAEGRVQGVLLWNVWGQVDAARALIWDRTPRHRDSLIGRIRDTG